LEFESVTMFEMWYSFCILNGCFIFYQNSCMSRKFRWFLVLFVFFVSGGIFAQNYTIEGDVFWTVNVPNACYSGGGVVACSSPDERGCVTNPIWTTW